MLDEKALRKPEFSLGTRVRLADGQEWTLPRPRLRFNPRVTPAGVTVESKLGFGPEADHLLDILWGVVPADPVERLRARFEIVVQLLAANYDLKPDDFASLLILEPGDPASENRWNEIGEAIAGQAPKPSPAI